MNWIDGGASPPGGDPTGGPTSGRYMAVMLGVQSEVPLQHSQAGAKQAVG